MELYVVNLAMLGRIEWLTSIANAISSYGERVKRGDEICIQLPSQHYQLGAMHLASMGCLIEYFDKKQCRIRIEGQQDSVKFFMEKLKWQSYWLYHEDYTSAEDDSIMNLWRVSENAIESYTQNVCMFLKHGRFRNKDLSAVSNSLLEAYYNIFDHADANGIAFSFIRYLENEEKLSVAICDLGKGIAVSVKEKRPDIIDDGEAIELAMQDRFTSQSKLRNKGLGLGNIRMACTEDDSLRIISNRGFLVATRDEIIQRNNNLDFPGTLIFYELSLSHFENEEIIPMFEFD